MTNTLTVVTDETTSLSIIEPSKCHSPTPIKTELLQQSLIKVTSWTERIKNYFITHDGRISLVEFLFALTCVIIQHIMGTCHHYLRDGTNLVNWHMFAPPFGAGPQTALFFFILSWITLFYCVERLWNHIVIGMHASKKHDLLVHGMIGSLFLTAFAFNVWGYVLCESTTDADGLKQFVPGVCRGDSKACIPLLPGVLIACATACAFFSEHILALIRVIKARQEMQSDGITRIIP
ncbi:unnamed protein product [Adineta ricciae]|uniref:Uncharacterized protein n=1 Tax=Adineta ricciae TaxID=249248 RepID=A0A815ED98_ADIRI|nr:unnamed protein product [Adineta ricciae]